MSYLENPGFDHSKHNSANIQQEEIDLQKLLPRNYKSGFYRYSGSLTVPHCDEVVTWTIFTNPNFMSSSQIKTFRSMTNEEGKRLLDNDRPIQPLNNRIVQFSSGSGIYIYNLT